MRTAQLVLAFVLAAGIAGTASAQEAFTLRGEIAGMDGKKMYLMYDAGDGQNTVDSTVVEDGRFAFSGKMGAVSSALLANDLRRMQVGSSTFTMLWLEPADMAFACPTGDLREFTMTGSRTQDEQAELERMKAPVTKELQTLMEAYNASGDNAEREALKVKMAPLQEQAARLEADFVKSHPDSYVSLQLLMYQTSRMDYEEARAIYDGFSDRVKACRMAAQVLAEINALQLGVPGTEAYPFETTDIDGKPFRLADLRGKVVLLDFWASWCAPCRASNPHLKELYAEYKDKGFEIVCIADDDSSLDAWHKAIEKDGIGAFRHVLRGLKWKDGKPDKSTDISDRYGIHFLPTKILVGKDGMIVGRYGGGEEEQLDAKLAEIFGK